VHDVTLLDPDRVAPEKAHALPRIGSESHVGAEFQEDEIVTSVEDLSDLDPLHSQHLEVLDESLQDRI
jgi:hypothetical protein